MVNGVVDRRAVQILFSTYWSSSGWRRDRSTSPDDYAYAKSAGVMFEPRMISHDDAVSQARDAAAKIAPEKVASAFLASLSTRRLELRSALGSYAIARNLKTHAAPRSGACGVCGEHDSPQSKDLSVLNFERLKWGGVRHASPVYMALDLELFAKTSTITATKEDVEIFGSILKAADSLSGTARARDLEKAISGIVKSNKAEREALLQILGYASVFETTDHPGYLARFVEARDRDLPPASKIDWTYPFAWWRGANGSNRAAVEFWFSGAIRNAA
jgi:hypothetical protein